MSRRFDHFQPRLTHRTQTIFLEQMDGPIAEQHWAVAMAETCAAGCTCIFCTRRSVCIRRFPLDPGSHFISSQDTSVKEDHTRTAPRSRPRRHIRRSLPSTSTIMEVLYPSSYLCTPAFPSPPSYLQGDTHPSTAQEDHREHAEHTALISTAAAGETLVPSGHHDPLVEAPSLTGVPSSGDPSGRIPQAEHNPPVVGLGIDVLGDAGPPPAYSRFDESRSCLPIASDVLGPYPDIPALNPPA